MRVPVYPRGADPRFSRRILSKSLSYAEEEVQQLRANWVDPADHKKGIVPREFLLSSKVYTPIAEYEETLGPPPDAGLKFIPPANFQKNPLIASIHRQPTHLAAQGWDYSIAV